MSETWQKVLDWADELNKEATIQNVFFSTDLNTHDVVASFNGYEIGRYSFLDIMECASTFGVADPDFSWRQYERWQDQMITKAKDIVASRTEN
ncbi:hypothetical protein LCGC14_2156110 [marine sediment metagenome]|uniref:Uncharacterized protein n=1 Tax=marine sediment metagenome TaxID=412755 RepID=A0A0F9GQF8_9ZZZZ